MAITYEPLAITTLSSASSTITFSNIPSTYTDLRIVLVGTGSSNNANMYLTFNSDTGTNYSSTYLTGNGTAASSGRLTNNPNIYISAGVGLNTTIPGMRLIDILSYAGSTYKSTVHSESTDLNGSGTTSVSVGLWRSTAAITTIALTQGSGNFNTGTTATLYGIKKA